MLVSSTIITYKRKILLFRFWASCIPEEMYLYSTNYWDKFVYWLFVSNFPTAINYSIFSRESSSELA